MSCGLPVLGLWSRYCAPDMASYFSLVATDFSPITREGQSVAAQLSVFGHSLWQISRSALDTIDLN